MSNDPEKPNADLWRAMFDARWQPRLPAGGVSEPTLHSELNKDRNRSEERPA